jgi:hypothetical protein
MPLEPFDTLGGVEISHAISDGKPIHSRQNDEEWGNVVDGNVATTNPPRTGGSFPELRSAYRRATISEPSPGIQMALGRGAQEIARKRRRGIGSLSGAES